MKINTYHIVFRIPGDFYSRGANINASSPENALFIFKITQHPLRNDEGEAQLLTGEKLEFLALYKKD